MHETKINTAKKTHISKFQSKLGFKSQYAILYHAYRPED